MGVGVAAAWAREGGRRQRTGERGSERWEEYRRGVSLTKLNDLRTHIGLSLVLWSVGTFID